MPTHHPHLQCHLVVVTFILYQLPFKFYSLMFLLNDVENEKEKKSLTGGFDSEDIGCQPFMFTLTNVGRIQVTYSESVYNYLYSPLIIFRYYLQDENGNYVGMKYLNMETAVTRIGYPLDRNHIPFVCLLRVTDI